MILYKDVSVLSLKISLTNCFTSKSRINGQMQTMKLFLVSLVLVKNLD